MRERVSALAKTAQGICVETVQKSGFSPGRGYNAERRHSGRLKPCAIGLVWHSKNRFRSHGRRPSLPEERMRGSRVSTRPRRSSQVGQEAVALLSLISECSFSSANGVF